MSWNGKLRAPHYARLDWVYSNVDRFIQMCYPHYNMKAIDVGTGTGVVAGALARFVAQVQAVDSSREMLNVCKMPNNVQKIEASYADINSGQDLITARMLLHHLDNPGDAVKLLAKKLASNGRLTVCEGVPRQGCYAWFKAMFQLKEKRVVIAVDDLVQWFNDAGLENIELVVYEDKQRSTLNWLDNSGLDETQKKAVFNAHLHAPAYVKAAYNMQIRGGDIIADWLAATITGTKP